MSFSQYIGKHTESEDQFTRDLYGELIGRLRELRREPSQAEPADWRAWIVPVASSAVISAIFFTYIYSQF
jgi:hypothetical protein